MSRDPTLVQRIDETLEHLVETLDALDHDAFDVDSADGKVVLEFVDGPPLIVSRQGAANQIWLAEPAGGWHFDWDGQAWRCDKRGVELHETLGGLLSARTGDTIRLR